MRHNRQALVSGAIRDLRASWRVLAQTDLIYKLVSFALLTPGTLPLLRWAMSRAGTQVIADTEIATFFLTTRQRLICSQTMSGPHRPQRGRRTPSCPSWN